jgi:glycosyltransferase involved in cell wall biosynthesis
MARITGIITTLNEEQHIAEAIQSLYQICDEIIVVDSNSTHQTVSIASSLGAKTYLQSYLGDGIQKNFGIQFATNQWIFSMDADERVSPELASIIQNLNLDQTTYFGFAIRRRNLIGSRWVKSCGWYPDHLVRLFRHDQIRFRDVKQHASVPVENTQKLKGDLIHFRYKNLGELFAKPARNYSTRGAKILYLQGKKATGVTPFVHGFSAFFVNYFFKGAILEGIDGFTLALSIAVNSYLKYAKLLEFQRDPKVRDQEDFNSVW